MLGKLPSLSSKNGGGGEIRTLGTEDQYDSLANCWFKPLTHPSFFTKMHLASGHFSGNDPDD